MYTKDTKLPPGAKCTRCRRQATIRMPGHNAIFCGDCLSLFFLKSVTRGLKKMGLSSDEPLMVAVSGGKDSLALWNALVELGYETRGVHVNLGIEGFSEASVEAIENYASPRGLPWSMYSLEEIFGYSIPDIKRRTRRKICSVCGLLKRQMINRLTVREGFQTLATGHNLDDEAGRILGNTIRHRSQYFEKQYPILPSSDPRMPTKAKPLYRLESRDIVLYCAEQGIVPLKSKCPLSRGATSHAFKEALDLLEHKMPGTKRDFLFTYLDRRNPPPAGADFGECNRCGQPAFADTCSVCLLLEQLTEQKN